MPLDVPSHQMVVSNLFRPDSFLRELPGGCVVPNPLPRTLQRERGTRICAPISAVNGARRQPRPPLDPDPTFRVTSLLCFGTPWGVRAKTRAGSMALQAS